MRCYKKCVAGEGKPEIDGSHYHCNYCLTIRKRSDGFKNHLRKHITCKAGSTNEDDSRQADETEAGSINEHNEQIENPSVDGRDENDHPDSLFNENSSRWRCGQCNKDFASKKSLQNHTRFYHISPDYICSTRFLGGICVDPERGIYMIRRSFSGTSHPVHVMHNFGVDGKIFVRVKRLPGTVQHCQAKWKPEVHVQSLEKCPICCEKFQFPLHSTPRTVRSTD